ncbi:hypothetical protein F5Y14DRAFT_449009 [Nemania sp. NC0429]|nr:hypothetical protein F5Y14DRAFT_449009 [Nemania sp. NC0429]
MPRRKVRRGTRLWKMMATAGKVIALRRQLAAAIRELKAICRRRLKSKARRRGLPATAGGIANICRLLAASIKLLIVVFRRKIDNVTAFGRQVWSNSTSTVLSATTDNPRGRNLIGSAGGLKQ